MKETHPLDRLVAKSLAGGIPLTLFLVSLLAGVLSLLLIPREEEPQIVVPMVDVHVSAAGLSARQVERQVTTPLEKLLAQIPGVEHVYSVSGTARSTVTLRFHVGEDREISILNTYNKLWSNTDKVPPVVSNWMVQPVEVDDVPIVVLGLWSDTPGRYSDFELRRVADEISTDLQAIPDTSVVAVHGGRSRNIRLDLDPEALAARRSTPVDIARALQLSNQVAQTGRISLGNRSLVLDSGDVLGGMDELRQLVVNVVDGKPVYLQEVARVADGPEEAQSYTWIDFAGRHPAGEKHGQPMVAISVAKQRGSNAVSVAERVLQRMDTLKQELLPPEIRYEVLRDYGATANEKVNNLASSLAFAIITVVIFIGVFLGWRPALVVGLAVPISYGITLALDYALGYTINRVTLFALILSLGLLVDDPITGVDNITRFLRKSSGSVTERIVAAMSEIRRPLVMSTITIILAFVPLAFITGMMGPYMAPMAFNVPVAVIASTLVAFVVTPWLSFKLLKPQVDSGSGAAPDGLYRRIVDPLLCSPARGRLALLVTLALFVLTAVLPLLRMVPLKLLPFDNKNEIQVVIDMPEGATLEQTAGVAQAVSERALALNEVLAAAAFVGEPSPIDFNGMVRQYYARHAPHNADIRLTLLDKREREHQSHGVVMRLRQVLAPLAVDGRSIKVVEVPPGPPVLSTLVAEVYGTALQPYSKLEEAAAVVAQRLVREPHVVEVDTSVAADHERLLFAVDKSKAALSGIATDDVNTLLQIANHGQVPSYLHLPREARPLPIELRLPQDGRASLADLEGLLLKGRPGIVQSSSVAGLDAAPQPLVTLGELGRFQWQQADKPIFHKDLQPIVYVTAELNGRTPAEVIADVSADLGAFPRVGEQAASDWKSRTFLNSGGGDSWQLSQGVSLSWSGEGEWRITVDVFRDMGIAFAFALMGIFFVLKIQTGSAALAGIIMSSIPLTIIGIMPGFWLLNQFGERWIAGAPEPVLFTATAMIGMIALAGIVVRNSLILVEFIGDARAAGMPMKEALLQAGSVRMRPVLLTAGTTLLGNLVIILDPVFSGLALAIIFGIVASTLFTLLVVPVVYQMVFSDGGAGDQVESNMEARTE